MSVCHTGTSWCPKCHTTGHVEGARMIGYNTLNCICGACSCPVLYSTPPGTFLTYDEERLLSTKYLLWRACQNPFRGMFMK